MKILQDSLHIEILPPYSADTVTRKAPAKPSWVHMPPMVADSGTVYTQPQLLKSYDKANVEQAVDYCSPNGKMRDISFTKPLLRNAFIDSLTAKIETVPFRPQGYAGDPLPYRFKNDDYVSAAVLLSFFLMIWVITRSRYYLKNSLKNLFHPASSASVAYTPRTENELRGQIFLIFQTCFTLGVLAFDYVQVKLPDVFLQVSPYKILLLSTGIFALYYVAKIILYYFVNSVFFDRGAVTAWSETYLLSVLFVGISLFPVALLVVYFDLSFKMLIYLLILVLVLSKIILIYKSFSIFSASRINFIHIILYLCALEILPPFVLWRSLNYALNVLAAID